MTIELLCKLLLYSKFYKARRVKIRVASKRKCVQIKDELGRVKSTRLFLGRAKFTRLFLYDSYKDNSEIKRLTNTNIIYPIQHTLNDFYGCEGDGNLRYGGITSRQSYFLWMIGIHKHTGHEISQKPYQRNMGVSLDLRKIFIR